MYGHQPKRWSSRRLAAISLGALLACGGNDLLPPDRHPGIRIDPAVVAIERARDTVLHLRDQSGTEVRSPDVRWSSDRPAIVGVNDAGRIFANRAGLAVISAVAWGETATATITVGDSAAGVVSSVTVDADRSFAWVGDTLTVRALVRNRWGEALHAAPAWSSSAPSVASVSAEGVVRGRSAGRATITATSGTVAGSREIVVEAISSLSLEGTTVLVPGSEAPLTLVARSGSLTGIIGASWTSSDPSVATVSARGMIAGAGEGTTTIGATYDGTTLRADVMVRSLGGRILFIEEGGPRLLRLDGSAPVPVKVSEHMGSPAISPDGREVAYECGTSVCRASLDGTRAPSPVIAWATFASWTGDGRTIAARTGYSQITIASLQSGDVRRLSLNFYIERPRLSPDGLQVAFECDYADPYGVVADLCVSPTSGSGPEWVVAGATMPAWSPDGRSISYMRDNVLCVAAVAAPATCTRIFSIPLSEVVLQATWSPDGTHLVVARADGLWVVEATGANPVLARRSTSPNARFASPSWGADPR